MAVEPIQPQSLAADGGEHQSLLDRFYGLFHGAFSYVEQFFPDHELKDEVLTSVKAAWDNTTKAVKDDYAKASQAVVSAAETAAPVVVSAAEDAAQAVVSGVSQAVKGVADAVTSENSTTGTPSS